MNLHLTIHNHTWPFLLPMTHLPKGPQARMERVNTSGCAYFRDKMTGMWVNQASQSRSWLHHHGSRTEMCQRTEGVAPSSWVSPLFVSPQPSPRSRRKKHPKARRQNFPYFGQEGLLKARFETSCCGSVVLTGDGRDHHTSVLVLAFFASCGFPPFDLSEAFTHKDEHLVRSQG